jgi:hypothetical protein
MIDELIKEMLSAAEEDDRANQEILHALNKLKMLSKVVLFLKVVNFHDTFLPMEGCIILARWLSPLPDGSIPCNMIRQSLLEAVQDLPISTDNLQRSGLGTSDGDLQKPSRVSSDEEASEACPSTRSVKAPDLASQRALNLLRWQCYPAFAAEQTVIEEEDDRTDEC